MFQSPVRMNNNHTAVPQTEGAPLSRATSRTSRASTLSRHQSLIKRSIEMHDLKPADVLIERFTAWKAIVRQLTAWFEVRLLVRCGLSAYLTLCAGYRGNRE